MENSNLTNSGYFNVNIPLIEWFEILSDFQKFSNRKILNIKQKLLLKKLQKRMRKSTKVYKEYKPIKTCFVLTNVYKMSINKRGFITENFRDEIFHFLNFNRNTGTKLLKITSCFSRYIRKKPYIDRFSMKYGFFFIEDNLKKRTKVPFQWAWNILT